MLRNRQREADQEKNTVNQTFQSIIHYPHTSHQVTKHSYLKNTGDPIMSNTVHLVTDLQSLLPLTASGSYPQIQIIQILVIQQPVLVTQPQLTPTPITQIPVTQTLVIQTLVTQTPLTQTPHTQTPGTQKPVTQTPVTQTPVTQTPNNCQSD